MISAEKAASKKIQKLIDSAQKLAAVQYLFGLHPNNERIKDKVNKSWQEFQLASDSVLATKFVIKQENGRSITLDMNPEGRER